MNEPLISIIIAARNAEKTIEKCMTSVLEIDYPAYEVIVVDDGSTDNTPKFLEKYRARIEVISNALSAGPSEARNIAAKYARGDYLAFTDADCIVSKDWLRELLRGLQEFPEAVSCGGRQEIPIDAGLFQKKVFLFMKKIGFLTDYIRRGSRDTIEVSHNASCCVMYKKDFFLKEGGFLKGLWPGEDVELDYRLRKKGYKLVFNSGATVYHYRPDNFKKFYNMMYRYGYAQGCLVRKYGIFRRIQILPAAFFIFTVLSLSGLYLNWRIALGGMGLLFLGLFIYLSSTLFFGLLGIAVWHMGYIKGIARCN